MSMPASRTSTSTPDTSRPAFANFFPALSTNTAWPMSPFGLAQDFTDYWTDAYQRGALFLDILRQRGDEQAEMTSRPMATVLTFEHEIIMSGGSLPRPINFSLARVIPPAGATIDPTKRPIVIVDPRAGQGPGIGGFHYQSEIGDAFAAGHQVYFIGFSANPIPGQTFLDVVEGQIKFFERIAALHPNCRRPFAVGNCQALLSEVTDVLEAGGTPTPESQLRLLKLADLLKGGAQPASRPVRAKDPQPKQIDYH